MCLLHNGESPPTVLNTTTNIIKTTRRSGQKRVPGTTTVCPGYFLYLTSGATPIDSYELINRTNMICDCCSISIVEGTSVVNCSSCQKPYHAACLTNLLGSDFQLCQQYSWLCPTCKPRTRNADNTPVRNTQGGDLNITLRKKGTSANTTSDVMPKEFPVTSTEVNRIMKKQIDDLMRHLNETLAQYVNKELKAITDKIDGLKTSVTFMNDKFEEMRTEFLLNTKVVSDIKKENEQLKSTVKDLSSRLNQVEQQARSSNLEIQCLPEYNNENLVTTVMNINRVISGDLVESNIHHVTRIAKQTPNNKRPKSIVVQFSSPRVRDNFLAASIKFNKNKTSEEKLNTGLLGIGGKKENVFIVEHLSPANKALHAATRIKAKSLGYQYVWVRGGRIFARKTDGADYKYIKDTETLDKLQ